MEKDITHKEIARYLIGQCTAEEESRISDRIKNDPRQKALFLEIKKQMLTGSSRHDRWSTEDNWQMLSRRIDEYESSHRKSQSAPKRIHDFPRNDRSWVAKIAAVFAILILAGVFAHYLYPDDHEASPVVAAEEVVTEKGQRARIQLEDGTYVRLNVDSKLSYPAKFDPESRRVTLTGEAYFDVAPGDKPFLVETGEAVVEVLGTKFNIRAYDDLDELNVVVSSGEVAVKAESLTDKVSYLGRGDMAMLNRVDGLMEVRHNVDLQEYLGWLDQRFSFHNDMLTDVVRKLERWFAVDFTLTDPELAELRFTATFEDETLNEVLRVLELALNIDYEINGSEIRLSTAN